MLVLIRISTGAFIEHEHPPVPGAMLARAIARGLPAGDIAEREVTPEEYRALIEGPRSIVSYALLRARLTDGERAAILTACRANWQIDDFVRLAQAENQIDVTSATTLAAKAALVAAGLLTGDRADVVFAPPPPPPAL